MSTEIDAELARLEQEYNKRVEAIKDRASGTAAASYVRIFRNAEETLAEPYYNAIQAAETDEDVMTEVIKARRGAPIEILAQGALAGGGYAIGQVVQKTFTGTIGETKIGKVPTGTGIALVFLGAVIPAPAGIRGMVAALGIGIGLGGMSVSNPPKK